MRILLQPRLALFAALAVAASGLLGTLGWPQPGVTFEFAGLVITAIVVGLLAAPRTSEDRPAPALSFAIDFGSLLLIGPHATMIVAGAGAVVHAFACSARLHSDHSERTGLRAMAILVALQAAGWTFVLMGGTIGHFVWPADTLATAAAVGTYCLMRSAIVDIAAPLAQKRALDPGWITRPVDGLADHVIAASIAAALVIAVQQGRWEVLPLSTIPLAIVYFRYRDYLNRLAEDERQQQVVQFRDEGMAVIDRSGRITAWSEALERLLGCPRGRALGYTLTAAVPAIEKSEVPRAIEHAKRTLETVTLPQVWLTTSERSAILQVKVVPMADVVTLLWQDATDRIRTEQSLKRVEERLALAADGAHDGLWEWDLRTEELYMSSRWRAMLGLPAAAALGHPEEWTDRVHPEDIAALKDALEAHLAGKTDHFEHQHRIRHEDGVYRQFLCRGVAVRGRTRRAMRIGGSLTDTTEQAVAEERLRIAGFLDPLTGLCNRAIFVEGLGRRLDEYKQRRVGGRFAVLYLDLDRFKVVNDSLGHLVGDELLSAVSRRLESCVRPGDALARLGGDEFAILLNGLTDEQQANAIALRIQEALAAPFAIGGRNVFTSASIGIAFGMAQYTNPDEIIHDADTAMYHAKARGKARHELFDADMHAQARLRLGLESDLRHAVSVNGFEAHYQPIVALGSGMCVGFEALVRWTRDGKSISPATFIPIAEELGLIEPIGTFVLQQACRTFADWQRRYPQSGLEFISVNVSSRQLVQQNFLFLVEQAVHTAGLKPSSVRLEITETALMDRPNEVAELLRELRNFGVKIYLDDFGTGYSSLSHLHKLPVDALKIDRSFVNSLQLQDRPAIVESILALARTLNTSVVAEGIESALQARELERLGCTHAQGFYFSRPLASEAVEAMLIANEPLGPKPGTAAVVTGNEPVMAYASVPFSWPDHLTVHPPLGDSAVPPPRRQ